MDSKKPNKISEIVRLQQMLKKWKKLANTPKTATTTTTTTTAASKSIKFIKRTLSFSDINNNNSGMSNDIVVPKGFLAVCVGQELRRYVIPMDYLAHKAFKMLLRQAEEEFGFQQEGILRIPCEVFVFEKILKLVEEKKEVLLFGYDDMAGSYCSSPDRELTPSHHQQMCR